MLYAFGPLYEPMLVYVIHAFKLVQVYVEHISTDKELYFYCVC